MKRELSWESDFVLWLPEDEKEWENVLFLANGRLSRYLMWISINARTRKHLQAHAQAELSTFSHIYLSLKDLPVREDGVNSIYVFIEQKVAAEKAKLPQTAKIMVHLSDWEYHAVDEKNAFPFISQLNFERERIFQYFDFPLVFWSDEYVIKTVQRLAPDFWDWVTYDFYFKTQAPNTQMGGSQMRSENDGSPFDVYQLTAYLDQIEKMGKPCLEDEIQTKDYVSLLKGISQQYQKNADYTKALEYAFKIRDIYEAGINDALVQAENFRMTGDIYHDMGYSDKAMEFAMKSLHLLEQEIYLDHPDLAQSYNNVGVIQISLGDYSKALEYALKALAIREKVLSEDHPDLAMSYNNLAATYGDLGNYKEQLAYNLKALAIFEKVLPKDHPDLALSYNNLGQTYRYLENHKEELAYNLKALAIFEKVLSKDHPYLALSYCNLAGAYGNLGNHKEELAYNLKALAIFEKVLSKDHPNLAQSYNNLAHTYYYLQEELQALAYFQKAITIRKKALPIGHHKTKSSIENMGRIIKKWEKAGKKGKIINYILWYNQIKKNS